MHAAEGGGYVTTVTLADERSFASDQPVQLDSDTLAQLLAATSDPLGYGQLLFDTFLAGKPRGRRAGRRIPTDWRSPADPSQVDVSMVARGAGWYPEPHYLPGTDAGRSTPRR